jgi:calpain-15
MYAKPHKIDIWVMLLEKAWAKVFGSYRGIELGYSNEGFTALSGAPSEIYDEKIVQN